MSFKYHANGSSKNEDRTIASVSTKKKKAGMVTREFEYESETDEEEVDKIRAGMNVSITPDYMQIAKLIKYAKRGNQTATVLALVALADFDLQKNTVQSSLLHVDGVNLLVNLLRSNDSRSKIAALKILKQIASNRLVIEIIIRMQGVEVLVQDLSSMPEEIIIMSADVISDIASSRRARKQVRNFGGLNTLLQICQQPELDEDRTQISTTSSRHSRNSSAVEAVKSRSSKPRPSSVVVTEIPLHKIQSATCALWHCCRSALNRKAVIASNVSPYLIKLLETMTDEILHMNIIGIIHSCCSNGKFRQYMLSAGLMRHLVKAMKSEMREFQILGLKAFSMCGDEELSRDQLRNLDGLELLLSMLHKGMHSDVDMLIAATCAIWKSITNNQDNVNWFKDHSIAHDLVHMLQHTNSEVIVNSLGIVSELAAKRRDNCKLLLDNHIIKLLIKHLETTDSQIIMAASKAAKSTAIEEETRRTIIGDDGFRFLWSHLRSRNEEVVSTALDAIFDMVQNPEETATTVRSFLGGLEVLISLMKSKNIQIRNSTCNVVSRVALDAENLEVLDDYDFSLIIVELCTMADKDLQKALCSCIVSYAINDEYRMKLKYTIPHLGKWLTSPDFSVKKQCTHALYKLSFNKENSLMIYQKGAVKHLISLIICDDEDLQESAAECVRNIRLTTVHTVEGHIR